MKLSKEFENQVKKLDLVERVELLKSRHSLMQDPFIRVNNIIYVKNKLAIYGPGTLLG